jgi:hypothetical protein
MHDQENIFKFKFKATFCNGWPSLRFCVDNDVLQEFYFEQEYATVEIAMDLVDGDHILEIERFGKTNKNFVFENNSMIQDQTVELLDIYIDNIQLPLSFKHQGHFCFDDQKISGGLLWGPNGTYFLNFKTPLISWIIAEKLEKLDENLDSFIPNKYNLYQLSKDLSKFHCVLNEK